MVSGKSDIRNSSNVYSFSSQILANKSYVTPHIDQAKYEGALKFWSYIAHDQQYGPGEGNLTFSMTGEPPKRWRTDNGGYTLPETPVNLERPLRIIA